MNESWVYIVSWSEITIILLFCFSFCQLIRWTHKDLVSQIRQWLCDSKAATTHMCFLEKFNFCCFEIFVILAWKYHSFQLIYAYLFHARVFFQKQVKLQMQFFIYNTIKYQSDFIPSFEYLSIIMLKNFVCCKILFRNFDMGALCESINHSKTNWIFIVKTPSRL